ncbi:MAG: hypothetical protein ACK56I_15345, partial [bacterium]
AYTSSRSCAYTSSRSCLEVPTLTQAAYTSCLHKGATLAPGCLKTLEATRCLRCCFFLKIPLLVLCGFLLVRQLKEVKAGKHGWDCIMLDRASVPGSFMCNGTACLLLRL